MYAPALNLINAMFVIRHFFFYVVLKNTVEYTGAVMILQLDVKTHSNTILLSFFRSYFAATFENQDCERKRCSCVACRSIDFVVSYQVKGKATLGHDRALH